MANEQQWALELAVDLREAARKLLGQKSCTGNREVRRGLARQALAFLQESEELCGRHVGWDRRAFGNLAQLCGPGGATSGGSPVAGDPGDRQRGPWKTSSLSIVATSQGSHDVGPKPHNIRTTRKSAS